MVLYSGISYNTVNNKMINKKYQAVRTVPQSNWKSAERRKINTTNTHVHESSLSWLYMGISINSAGLN
jgi:hypothetical protein